MSSDGVELTSFTSVSSRATNDDQASALDRHKLDTSSSAALHWPLNSEEFEIAVQAPLQPSDNTRPHSTSQRASNADLPFKESACRLLRSWSVHSP